MHQYIISKISLYLTVCTKAVLVCLKCCEYWILVISYRKEKLKSNIFNNNVSLICENIFCIVIKACKSYQIFLMLYISNIIDRTDKPPTYIMFSLLRFLMISLLIFFKTNKSDSK